MMVSSSLAETGGCHLWKRQLVSGLSASAKDITRNDEAVIALPALHLFLTIYSLRLLLSDFLN
jgi:hypothetical protein